MLKYCYNIAYSNYKCNKISIITLLNKNRKYFFYKKKDHE